MIYLFLVNIAILFFITLQINRTDNQYHLYILFGIFGSVALKVLEMGLSHYFNFQISLPILLMIGLGLGILIKLCATLYLKWTNESAIKR